jgi:hypothetical protein
MLPPETKAVLPCSCSESTEACTDCQSSAYRLCEGGELLDRILARGGRFSEKDTQDVVRQILGVVAWCHLQGVVHRDLKPEVSAAFIGIDGPGSFNEKGAVC